MLTPDNNIVDLILFGGIEQNGEVLIKGHKVVELSVIGTKEVTEKAEVIEDNFNFRWTAKIIIKRMHMSQIFATFATIYAIIYAFNH